MCEECGTDVSQPERLIDDLIRERNEVLEALQWQPIETAPKTDRAILVYCPGCMCSFTATWDKYCEVWEYFGGMGEMEDAPSHWMNLPEPPK
jgi:hypothetical protein